MFTNNIKDEQYLIMKTIAAPIISITKKQTANWIAKMTRIVVSKIHTHYNDPYFKQCITLDDAATFSSFIINFNTLVCI